MRRMGPYSKQPDSSTGHQQEKGITVQGLTPGTQPLDANLWRVPEESWQQALLLPMHPRPVPHLLQVELSATLSPFTLPVCTVQARGQSTGVSQHLASPPQDIPMLGGFL